MHHNFDGLNNLMDADLIRLVQCQDENAFTELVSRFSPRIWDTVVQNSRQIRDAEEILMDIWLAVWQNIIGLRKVDSFGAWLRKIARTACNRYYASKRHQHDEIIMSYEDLAAQIDRESEQRFHSAKLRSDAREAVHQLPQKVRPIAQMYYLDLSSVKEIADEFNLPIGTVKSKLSETRKLLQKEFEIEPKRSKSMIQKSEKPESESQGASTPSPIIIERNASTAEEASSSTTDPNSANFNSHNIHSIMFCTDQIPDKVKTTIDNIASIEILPD